MNKRSIGIVLGVIFVVAAGGAWYLHASDQEGGWHGGDDQRILPNQPISKTLPGTPPHSTPGPVAPPGSLEACTGKQLHDSCTFTFMGKPLHGSCQKDGTTIACGPNSASSTASTTHRAI